MDIKNWSLCPTVEGQGGATFSNGKYLIKGVIGDNYVVKDYVYKSQFRASTDKGYSFLPVISGGSEDEAYFLNLCDMNESFKNDGFKEFRDSFNNQA